jgi:hypothetical protein
MQTPLGDTTEFSLQELQQWVQIDVEHLEREWTDQPERQLLASLGHAKAQLELNRHRFRIEQREAQLDGTYRREGIPGVEKITEKAIDAAVASNSELVELREQELQRQYAVNVYRGLCVALEQRVAALKALYSMPGLREGVDTEEELLALRAAREISNGQHR